MQTPVPGQTVLYTPDTCYGLDVDAKGNPLFALHHPDKDQPFQWPRLRLGQPYRGKKPRIGKPLASWPAIVRAVHADGSADLEISHPRGYRVHHMRVRPGNTDTLGTYHLEGLSRAFVEV